MSVTVQTSRTVTVSQSPPAPPPVVALPDLSSLFVAGPRDVTVNPLLGEQVTPAGVVSGLGSQGTQNTAHLQGHAGTAANQAGLPRQIKVGGSSILGTV